VSYAKTAELIEMLPLRVWTSKGPSNHVVDGSPDPLGEKAILGASPGQIKNRENLACG